MIRPLDNSHLHNFNQWITRTKFLHIFVRIKRSGLYWLRFCVKYFSYCSQLLDLDHQILLKLTDIKVKTETVV